MGRTRSRATLLAPPKVRTRSSASLRSLSHTPPKLGKLTVEPSLDIIKSTDERDVVYLRRYGLGKTDTSRNSERRQVHGDSGGDPRFFSRQEGADSRGARYRCFSRLG